MLCNVGVGKERAKRGWSKEGTLSGLLGSLWLGLGMASDLEVAPFFNRAYKEPVQDWESDNGVVFSYLVFKSTMPHSVS